MLNLNSWIGKPVPVIPLTIKEYASIMKFIYENSLEITDFYTLLKEIHLDASKYTIYNDWYENIPLLIEDWKSKQIKK